MSLMFYQRQNASYTVAYHSLTFRSLGGYYYVGLSAEQTIAFIRQLMKSASLGGIKGAEFNNHRE